MDRAVAAIKEVMIYRKKPRFKFIAENTTSKPKKMVTTKATPNDFLPVFHAMLGCINEDIEKFEDMYEGCKNRCHSMETERRRLEFYLQTVEAEHAVLYGAEREFSKAIDRWEELKAAQATTKRCQERIADINITLYRMNLKIEEIRRRARKIKADHAEAFHARRTIQATIQELLCEIEPKQPEKKKRRLAHCL